MCISFSEGKRTVLSVIHPSLVLFISLHSKLFHSRHSRVTRRHSFPDPRAMLEVLPTLMIQDEQGHTFTTSNGLRTSGLGNSWLWLFPYFLYCKSSRQLQNENV